MIKKAIAFIKNTEIDIRIRLLYLVEYAALCATLIGTITMLFFTTTIVMLIPNLVLLIFCITGLFLSHYKEKYELAMNQFIVGCAYISLPFMFFTAGGNKSGMIIWFLFGTIFSCVITKGKGRIVMPAIMILISSICMLVGYYNPDFVIPLENDSAAFFDSLQSYVVVSLMTCATLYAYLSTYDRQSRILEEQRAELQRMVYTDALTGIENRHAYYEKIGTYKEEEPQKNLVILSMDVNGLKRVNDTQGHAAGDAYIQCAAEIIKGSFEKYGNVYRTGGDEFMAVLFCEDQEKAHLEEILHKSIAASESEWAKVISIAVGIAGWNDNRELSFFELEKLADRRMYENKRQYYQSSGIDRRRL